MANFSFNSSRAPIYSEELLRRAEDDIIALNELEEFNSSSYKELNSSIDNIILAVEGFTKVGNHAIRKKNECGVVDFLYGSTAEIAKESEGSVLDAVTIALNRVGDSYKDKKRFVQEVKSDLYRNLQHELDGTGVVVSETLYPNLCAFLTEYPKELEKRKEAEEAKAIEQAKRGVPCVGHVCSDKSISVSKKMPAIQFFNEDAPKSKPLDRLFSINEPKEVERWREKYGDKFLSDAAKALEGMPSYEKVKVGDTPKTSALEGEKPSKNNPIDKPCPQKDLDDFLRFIEKHGDRREYEALKEIVDAPFEEKPKGGDAPKTTAPDSKKSEKKDIPIVFISAEDGIVAEVPEDSILEFLDLMEMLGED